MRPHMDEPEKIERLIIPSAEAANLVRRAGRIYVKDCVCRVRERACSNDVDVCLHFEGASAEDLQDARPVAVDEALAILDRTARWGAIYQIFFTQATRRVTELCSCCACCCAPLRRMRTEGNYAQVARSGYAATTDAESCTACGQCQESCLFGARWVEDGLLRFADERCFGCGRCVEGCPQEAIRLERQVGRGVEIPR